MQQSNTTSIALDEREPDKMNNIIGGAALAILVAFCLGILVGQIIEDRGNYINCLERGEYTAQQCKEIVK
jgi:hypothetical protein